MSRLSQAQISSLESGAIVTDVSRSASLKGGMDIVGAVDLDASLETIWLTMVDCSTQIRFVPGLKECSILDQGVAGEVLDADATEPGHRQTRWDLRSQTFKYAFPFPTIRSQIRSIYHPFQFIEISGAGGDIAALDSRWDFIPQPNGKTRVIYHATMKPKLPVPGGLIRKSTAKDMPLLFERLRAIVEMETPLVP